MGWETDKGPQSGDACVHYGVIRVHSGDLQQAAMASIGLCIAYP